MIRNLSSFSTFIKNTSVSSYDPLGLFSLAYTISQLTHSIFTLWSPPSCACTPWGAKNKGGSVYSVHPSLPSSTVSLPSTPSTPPHQKKNQADDCCIKKCSGTGVQGSGDRNRRNASLLTLQSKSWENYLESCLIPSLIFLEMHLLIRGMTCLSFPELLLIISAG